MNEKFFYILVCFIINHDFYLITIWIRLRTLRIYKVDCYYYLSFASIRFLKIIYDIFKIWGNFSKTFLNWQCFISIFIAFIFNIIFAPKITYSIWFIIIFFFLFKKLPNITNYAVFDCFGVFFILKKKIILLTVLSSIFFSLKRVFISLIMLSSFLIFFKLNFLSCD